MKYILLVILFVALSSESFAGCSGGTCRGGVCKTQRTVSRSSVKTQSSLRHKRANVRLHR